MTAKPEQNFDVVISGASFAGLALARALRQAFGPELAICLIDRAPSPPPKGSDQRAFAVWAASKTMLAGLGAWNALERVAEAMREIEITDSSLDDGLRPALVTYDAQTSAGAPVAYMVPSEALHAALYGLVAADPGVTWMAPAEVTSASLAPETATLALADGRTVAARLAVAAEGRQSKLREAAGIKTVGWGYGQRGIVATVQFAGPHHGLAIQHFLPGGPFAILPLKDDKACITWSSSDEEAARVLALDETGFLAELDKRIGGRFGVITLLGKPQSWPLDLRIARAFTATRLALIGDAAHGVHPVAGQGVNHALRDVAALAECLVDAARLGFDIADGQALQRYERWRRFDTTMSATAYDALNRLFSADNMLLRAGRDAGLGLVDRMPWLKTLIMDEAAGLTGDTPKMLRGEPV